MAFSDKYKLQSIPAAAPTATVSLSPHERARAKLLAALSGQHKLLADQLAGGANVIGRSGKQMGPRAFWLKNAVGVAFTPRLGNQFLFEKGQGVLVADLADLQQVLTDFEAAVQAGEFDATIMEIITSRSPRAPRLRSETGKRAPGRPKGN
jgi:hypothetical protein